VGIKTDASDNVKILNCEFYYNNTATDGCAFTGILTMGGAFRVIIDNCKFTPIPNYLCRMSQ
jgi:hypothetical protein